MFTTIFRQQCRINLLKQLSSQSYLHIYRSKIESQTQGHSLTILLDTLILRMSVYRRPCAGAYANMC